MDNITTIHFERAGGLTGISISYTFTAESLDREEAERLNHLLSISGSFRNKTEAAKKSRKEDFFEYKFTIVTISGREEFVFDDAEIPEEVWPLIRYLTQRAMMR